MIKYKKPREYSCLIKGEVGGLKSSSGVYIKHAGLAGSEQQTDPRGTKQADLLRVKRLIPSAAMATELTRRNHSTLCNRSSVFKTVLPKGKTSLKHERPIGHNYIVY